jgi:hypothetical protein
MRGTREPVATLRSMDFITDQPVMHSRPRTVLIGYACSAHLRAGPTMAENMASLVRVGSGWMSVRMQGPSGEARVGTITSKH